MDFISESFVLILSGILLLRIAGRKSISQMTLAQTVVMISIGTVIVQPIVEKSMMKAIVGATIFVITLLVLEYLQLHSNAIEIFITGKSKIVIENGAFNVKNLKKLRLTVDQLEMRLRNQGVTKVTDVKFATLEPNGQLGFELADDAKPLTVGEFKKLMQNYFPQVTHEEAHQPTTNLSQDIFEELTGQQQHNPKFLQ